MLAIAARFQALIMFGCTPYFFDSSAKVISSRIASSATLALNSGEWFFLLDILDRLFRHAIHLKHWLEFPRPPLYKALYDQDERVFSVDADWFFAKNADLELTIDLHLMPGFSLDSALILLTETFSNLLNEPITRGEINQARQMQVVAARNAARRPVAFLSFLKNVASDGFPPITPSVFVDILNETTDQDVIDFAEKVIRPSATSVVLAEKTD